MGRVTIIVVRDVLHGIDCVRTYFRVIATNSIIVPVALIFLMSLMFHFNIFFSVTQPSKMYTLLSQYFNHNHLNSQMLVNVPLPLTKNPYFFVLTNSFVDYFNREARELNLNFYENELYILISSAVWPTTWSL